MALYIMLPAVLVITFLALALVLIVSYLQSIQKRKNRLKLMRSAKVHIIDNRIHYALLLKIFTREDIGTEITQ